MISDSTLASILSAIKDKTFHIRTDLQEGFYEQGYFSYEFEKFRDRHLDGVKITHIIFDNADVPIFVTLQAGEETFWGYPAFALVENPLQGIELPVVPSQPTVSVTLTASELTHLINDVIAYIWDIKDKVLGKERSTFGTDLTNEQPITEEELSRLEQYGYFTRKQLLDRLKQIEAEAFPRRACQG